MKITQSEVVSRFGDVTLEAMDYYKNGGFILEAIVKEPNFIDIEIHVCFTPNDIYQAQITETSTISSLITQDASVWVTINRCGVPLYDDEVDTPRVSPETAPPGPFPPLRLAYST